MINMDPGPWYEHSGPSVQEVKIGLKSFIDDYIKKYGKIYFDYEKLISDVINDEIRSITISPDEYPFGSYRGYHTFVKPNLLKRIIKKIENKKKERAQKIINRYIMNYFIWPKYLKRFYSPPKGKGYLLLMKKYEK